MVHIFRWLVTWSFNYSKVFIEYAYVVWDPFFRRDINDLKKVQRRAVHLICGQRESFNSHTKDMSCNSWWSSDFYYCASFPWQFVNWIFNFTQLLLYCEWVLIFLFFTLVLFLRWIKHLLPACSIEFVLFLPFFTLTLDFTFLIEVYLSHHKSKLADSFIPILNTISQSLYNMGPSGRLGLLGPY